MAKTKKKAKVEAAKVQKTSDKKVKASKSTSKRTTNSAVEQENSDDTKGIIIEACKQCNAFKTRAQKLQTLLEEGKPGLTVTINPDKPRKGCFEVRNTETGDKYVSLLDMPRPFPPLKALDIDNLASEIIGKLEKV